MNNDETGKVKYDNYVVAYHAEFSGHSIRGVVVMAARSAVEAVSICGVTLASKGVKVTEINASIIRSNAVVSKDVALDNM